MMRFERHDRQYRTRSARVSGTGGREALDELTPTASTSCRIPPSPTRWSRRPRASRCGPSCRAHRQVVADPPGRPAYDQLMAGIEYRSANGCRRRRRSRSTACGVHRLRELRQPLVPHDEVALCVQQRFATALRGVYDNLKVSERIKRLGQPAGHAARPRARHEVRTDASSQAAPRIGARPVRIVQFGTCRRTRTRASASRRYGSDGLARDGRACPSRASPARGFLRAVEDRRAHGCVRIVRRPCCRRARARPTAGARSVPTVPRSRSRHHYVLTQRDGAGTARGQPRASGPHAPARHQPDGADCHRQRPARTLRLQQTQPQRNRPPRREHARPTASMKSSIAAASACGVGSRRPQAAAGAEPGSRPRSCRARRQEIVAGSQTTSDQRPGSTRDDRFTRAGAYVM